MKKSVFRSLLAGAITLSIVSTSIFLVSCNPSTKKLKAINKINYQEYYDENIEEHPDHILNLVINDFKSYENAFYKNFFKINNDEKIFDFQNNSKYSELLLKENNNSENDAIDRKDIVSKTFNVIGADLNFEKGLMYSLVIRTNKNNNLNNIKEAYKRVKAKFKKEEINNLKIKNVYNYKFYTEINPSDAKKIELDERLELKFMKNIFFPTILGLQAPIFRVWNENDKIIFGEPYFRKLRFDSYLKKQIKNHPEVFGVDDSVKKYINEHNNGGIN
ncbi:hypothetical protein [Spiroplasma endosymbiont of Crioceris asparagi]|uniref:hypothetical protein n=1 Tax=Spiroplasma endosymbiont of Crioceris asparagi TaxID=3066286 RepID=UPI0030D05119